MNKSFLVFFLVIVSKAAGIKQSDCQKFIQKTIKDITQMNFMELPMNTIMYSGITTNTPGQFIECNNANYSYFLVYLQNTISQNLGLDTFTSLCMPRQCTAEEVQIALAPFFGSAVVYDYPQTKALDGLSITGIVIICIWFAVLITWSCIISFKQPSLLRKAHKQDSSIISEAAQPLIGTAAQANPQVKLFNFYEGYQQLFKLPAKKGILSPIISLSVLGYIAAIEFSYRQTIAQNEDTNAIDLLNSFGGIFITNTEIVLNCIFFIFGLRLAYNIHKINSFQQLKRFYFDIVLKKWVLLFLMTFLIYSFLTAFTDQPLNKLWIINNGIDCPRSMWQIWFLFRNMQLDCKKCLPWMSIFSNQIFFIILSTPFLLIFKTIKKLGYGLFTLLIATSMFTSCLILESRNIIYEPAKLMNGQKEFVYEYQTNTFVRMGAFIFGLMFGLFFIEGRQKSGTQQSFEYKVAKRVRKTSILQIVLQTVGSLLMLLNFLLIIPYLDKNSSNKKPYAYLIFSPFFFIVGLALFLLPSLWEAENVGVRLVNRIFGWKKFVHIDRISMTLLMISPMVIGLSTYGMQSSILYNWSTLTTYMVADLLAIYLLSLLIAPSFECQLNSVGIWLQNKVYGNSLQHNALVLEE